MVNREWVNLAVQSLFAVAVIAVFLYLIVVNREIPADLSAIVGAVTALYLRSMIEVAPKIVNGEGSGNGKPV